jgi:hypothetical protein
MAEMDIDHIVPELSLSEKVSLLSGIFSAHLFESFTLSERN